MTRKLLLTVDHQFVRTPDGRIWVKTIYGYDFWKRYLEIFDGVRIVARVRDAKNLDGKMLLASGNRVEFFPLPQYRGPVQYAQRYFIIQKQMKNITTDCCCAIFRIPSPIASSAQKKVSAAGLPWCVEVVNDPWDTFAPGSFKSIVRPFVRLLFTYQVKWMARSACGVSYVTQFALQKRYPSYAKIHGETSDRFESYYSSIILRKEFFYSEHKLPANEFTIVHVNSCVTDYSKGHDVVIRTLKILRDKGYNAKVLFVGDGPARRTFEEYAKTQGVGDYVNFTGLLSSAAEVREKLISSDIMIFPTKGEGLPRTIIEAMAVGLPCLSTSVNGIPEMLSEEYMFEQQNAEAFAECTIRIINDKELYRRISRQNYEKAHEYEEEVLQERRSEFYTKLLKQVKKSEETYSVYNR